MVAHHVLFAFFVAVIVEKFFENEKGEQLSETDTEGLANDCPSTPSCSPSLFFTNGFASGCPHVEGPGCQ